MSSELGKFIKYKRGDKSLRDFAAFLEISHAYLDSLEKGFDPKTKKEINISTDLLTRLSKKLDVSVSTLLEMISGTDYETALSNYEIFCNINEVDDINELTYDDYKKFKQMDDNNEKNLIANEKGLNNSSQSELEILFNKNKNILTDSDKAIIKTIIEERQKEIDKELGEE